MRGPVLGVVGGSGGAGASTFAVVLAAVAARATLVDLDAAGGGIDVLLGIEDVAGARWSGLRVGGGRLDPGLLSQGLPRWNAVAVLAADAEPPAAAVGSVVDAAATLGPAVLDLGRAVSGVRATAVQRCALVLLFAVADVRGLSAARAVAAGLPAAPIGLVVRRGPVSPDEAAALTGIPLAGAVPAGPAPVDRVLRAGRAPRALARVAAGVLDAVAVAPVSPEPVPSRAAVGVPA
jgi:hypothetical protein